MTSRHRVATPNTFSRQCVGKVVSLFLYKPVRIDLELRGAPLWLCRNICRCDALDYVAYR